MERIPFQHHLYKQGLGHLTPLQRERPAHRELHESRDLHVTAFF